MASKQTEQQQVQFNITVPLSPAAFRYAKDNAKDKDPSALVAGWCAFFLDNQARGGILLTPEDHDYVAEMNDGKRFRDSRSLVAAIERGMGRESGSFAFTIQIDPAWVEPINEAARLANLTPEECVNGIVNQCISQGWLWDLNVEGGRNIPFTANMLKDTEALCEKHGVNSADIAGMIAEDRFLPITREAKDKAKKLTGKVDFTGSELAGLIDRLISAEAELAALKKNSVQIAA